jgi:membrane protein DedA with SNARE-associated domain
MSPDAIAALLGSWGYPLYVLLFLATAFGSPLTEDLLLLVGGYLVGIGVFDASVVAPLAFAALLATDAIYFSYGRALRAQGLRRDAWLRRLVRPGRLRVTRRWFARYGDGLVFLARLLPGTRIVVFVSAGLNGMPLGRFLWYDALAALILVPALLALGWALGERIGTLARTFEWIGDRALLVILVIVAGLLLRRWWLRVERRWLPPEPPVNDTPGE